MTVHVRQAGQICLVLLLVCLIAFNSVDLDSSGAKPSRIVHRELPEEGDEVTRLRRESSARNEAATKARKVAEAEATVLRAEVKHLKELYDRATATMAQNRDRPTPEPTVPPTPPPTAPATSAPQTPAAVDPLRWRQPELVADTAQASAPPRPQFSAHQCTGQVFAAEEWVGRSCYHRNICYHPSSHKFFYYRDPALEPPEVLPGAPYGGDAPYFNPRDQHTARGFIPQDMAVSLIP